jgi:hypothetical protein
VPYSVLDLIDQDINDHHDVPGHVINRICGGLNYTVDGPGRGTYDYPAENIDDEGVYISGTLAAESFVLRSTVPDEAYLTLGCIEGAGCMFELNRDYPIHKDAADLPGYVGVVYEKLPNESPPEAIALGTDGSIVFESCRIDQRDPRNNRVLMVNLTGQFKGTLEVVLPPDSTLHYSGLEGYFSLPFVTAGLAAEDVLQQYLEDSCEGGYPN